jgi:hypothetical protein
VCGSSNKAVADGAVSFYLDHVVSARVARFTYGTAVNIRYDQGDLEHKRRAHTRFTRMSGLVTIPHAFSTILAKVLDISPRDSVYSDGSYRKRRYLKRRNSGRAITRSIWQTTSALSKRPSCATGEMRSALDGWIQNVV